MSRIPQEQQALEIRFERQGIPRRHLYPGWYRLYRAAGLRVKPPVLLSLAEHFAWEGGSILAIVALCGGLAWWLLGIHPQALIVPACSALLIPLLNWLRYQRIRSRIAE